MAGFDNEVLFSPGVRLQQSNAQAITLMQDGTATNVSRINYTGDPNGAVAANPSSISHDPVSGKIWRKISGTGTTIWEEIDSAALLALTGNTGIASPDGAGNINVVTANSTVKFIGSGSTLTADFYDAAISNLVLGSALPSLVAGGQALTGLGAHALHSITSGASNIAIGTSTLSSATTASLNTMVGVAAGTALIDGFYNSAYGYAALANGTSAGSNAAFGFQALEDCTNIANTAIGTSSMQNLVGGQYNVALGIQSGANYTGSESSNVVIANAGILGESNALRIGKDGTGLDLQNKCFIAGIQGSTIAASAPVGVASTGQLSSLGFGSTGGIFQSAGAATSPTWTTATYPATTTINQILYSTATNVIGALASTNRAVLTSSSTGVPAWRAVTDGQIIIGSSSSQPAAANISAGAGISIVNGMNTITISATGGGLTWSDNSGSFTATSNTGYFLTAASTPTLPAAPTAGDICEFVVIAAATMTITGNTGQFIRLGNTITASAGTCVSATIGNTIRLVYRATGTTWWADSATGSWTLT